MEKPSIRMMRIRIKDETVDKMDGSERRRSGIKVVGTILASKLCHDFRTLADSQEEDDELPSIGRNAGKDGIH